MKTFLDALRRKDMTVTAELPLRKSTTAGELREALSLLGPAVDAVQLGDNRYSMVHMSPLAAAAIALDSGVDAIVQMTCRDRNRIALRADLLGAEALGVRSVILARGDKIPDKAAVSAKGVFDTKLAQLVALARQQPGLQPGALVTVFDPQGDWEAARIEEKLAAGIGFLQTQPCLNPILLRRYVDALVERRITRRAAVVVTVPLLTSQQEARIVKEAPAGALVPDATIERIVAADDPVREGIAACAEMLGELKEMPGVSGVNVHFQRDPCDLVAALEQSGMLRPE